jgi:hypothetical protein
MSAENVYAENKKKFTYYKHVFEFISASINMSSHKDVFTSLGRLYEIISAANRDYEKLLLNEPMHAIFVAAVTALVKMFLDRHGESLKLPHNGTSYISFMTTLFVMACHGKFAFAEGLTSIRFNCAALNVWSSVLRICRCFSEPEVKTWNDIPEDVTSRCLYNVMSAIELYDDFRYRLRGTAMELIDSVGGILFTSPR